MSRIKTRSEGLSSRFLSVLEATQEQECRKTLWSLGVVDTRVKSVHFFGELRIAGVISRTDVERAVVDCGRWLSAGWARLRYHHGESLGFVYFRLRVINHASKP